MRRDCKVKARLLASSFYAELSSRQVAIYGSKRQIAAKIRERDLGALEILRRVDGRVPGAPVASFKPLIQHVVSGNAQATGFAPAVESH